MENIKALGFLIDYCNRHLGEPGITQDNYNRWQQEILNSPEGRFTYCRSGRDIINELGY